MLTNGARSIRRGLVPIGVASVGLLLTAVALRPDDVYTASLGPLRFDTFYAAAYGFVFLLAYGVYEAYAAGAE